MINFTTPKITLVVEGIDLTEHEVFATLEQGRRELTKSGEDLTISAEENGERTDTKIVFRLSQEESAMFSYNAACAVQVNWLTANGTRGATEIKGIGVYRNLLDEVKEYGD